MKKVLQSLAAVLLLSALVSLASDVKIEQSNTTLLCGLAPTEPPPPPSGGGPLA